MKKETKAKAPVKKVPAKKKKVSSKLAEKPKVQAKPKKKGEYVMTMEVNGKIYESSADELKDAILGLSEHVAPNQVKTRAMFMLTYEGNSTNKIFSVIARTRRILSNEMTAFFFGRRLMQVLKTSEQ